VAGDDYELLFTAAPDDELRLLDAGQETGTTVSRIGRVTAGRGVEVVDAAGVKVNLAQPGYRHF
jgi:thiamine-monophosphate kinase